MSDNQDSFLNIKQNSSNSNQEQLDDSFIKKKLYKNKNQKGQQFEKFKPKTNKENIKNEKSLKGAENKLKSMLSVFLKNIESEEINENKKPNPIFKGAIDDAKKQNNKNNSIKKVKTISISHKDKSHSNYTRANSFRLSPKKINSNSNSNTKKKTNVIK